MDAYITYEPFSCLFTACVGNTKKVLFIYVVKVKCFVFNHLFCLFVFHSNISCFTSL